MTAVELMDVVYSRIERGNKDGATDTLFDVIDRWLCDGEFGEVDAALAVADPVRLGSYGVRSLLVITAAAREMLPSRPAFYARGEREVVRLRGREAGGRILRNLS